jgi:hypothetical protein
VSGELFECSPLDWFEHVHTQKQPPPSEFGLVECFDHEPRRLSNRCMLTSLFATSSTAKKGER